MDFEKILKRAAYAYVGAIAYAYEATKKAVDKCVVKGAETIDELRPLGEEIVLKVKTTINEKIPQPTYFNSLNDFVDSLSEEEKSEIKEKLLKDETESSCCDCENNE